MSKLLKKSIIKGEVVVDNENLFINILDLIFIFDYFFLFILYNFSFILIAVHIIRIFLYINKNSL